MKKIQLNKLNFYILFSICLIMLACAGSIPTLKEPVEGKNLLIGSIIFENSGFKNLNEVYTDNLEVAIIGICTKNGEEKIFGKWISTDKDGYFFIPNVPDGKYALKSLRVNLSGQAYLTIANEFRTTVDNYRIWPTENVTFSGTFFDIRPNEKIINLKHNYFTLFENQEIRYGSYDKIADFKASNGEMISRPMIFSYFIEQYPESGWKSYLQKVLDTYEY